VQRLGARQRLQCREAFFYRGEGFSAGSMDAGAQRCGDLRVEMGIGKIGVPRNAVQQLGKGPEIMIGWVPWALHNMILDIVRIDGAVAVDADC